MQILLATNGVFIFIFLLIFYDLKCNAALIIHTYCNDLFSRFEQQILSLEKQAETTEPTTDRHEHDGPSRGLVSKHLENLKLGTENRPSKLVNGITGRTVTGVTDRSRLFSGN